uniref:ARID domain-containing protein n=1 Tax=Globodera pallida TaxID=36090 RepID=A0A183CH99_GLOPA
MFGDPNAMLLLVNQPDLFPVCHFEQLQFLMFAVEKLAKQDGNYVLIRRFSFIELRGSPVLTRRDKENAWEAIRQAAIAGGCKNLAEKDWKYIRDGVWGPARRDAVKKYDISQRSGEGAVRFSQQRRSPSGKRSSSSESDQIDAEIKRNKLLLVKEQLRGQKLANEKMELEIQR